MVVLISGLVLLRNVVLDTRFLVAIGGGILSVALHELFHIIMHWGSITGIHLFGAGGAIAEVEFVAPPIYDINIEELCAYTITAVTLLLTVKLLWELQDALSTKTSNDILTQNIHTFDHMNPIELLDFMQSKKFL